MLIRLASTPADETEGPQRTRRAHRHDMWPHGGRQVMLDSTIAVVTQRPHALKNQLPAIDERQIRVDAEV